MLVIAFEREQPFLLGLQLHETSGQVDASIGSGTQLRICPVIRRLGIFDLHTLRIDPCGGRKNLEISSSDGQHHQLS